MPSTASLLALASAVSSAAAAYQGFNYGSTFTNGSPKAQSDFEADFKTAAGLEGTKGGFTSARLYTMVQAGTANDVISAIPAAINTKTSLLFGLWASGGEDAFKNELSALQKTIDQYCDKLDGLVAGISVGSEDLYRSSPIGIAAGENPGVNPEVLVDYISQTRNVIKGTCLSGAKIGHVDTWTVYVNGSNSPLIDAVDWVGMDAYAYFESTLDNPIENGKSLFQDALAKTKNAAGGKPVWVTETGWPVSGKTSGKGVPSKENAKTFWDEVGCPMFGADNVWWFTLQDSAPDTPNPSFGVIGSELTTKPIYDLSCDDVKTPSESTSSKASASATKSQSSAVVSASSSSADSDTTLISTTSKPAQDTTSASVGETTSESAQDTTTAAAPTTTSSGNEGGSGGNAGTTVTINTDNSGSQTTADSGAGSQTTATGTSANPTASASQTGPPQSSGHKLNSMGAAAIALVLAVAAF